MRATAACRHAAPLPDTSWSGEVHFRDLHGPVLIAIDELALLATTAQRRRIIDRNALAFGAANAAIPYAVVAPITHPPAKSPAFGVLLAVERTACRGTRVDHPRCIDVDRQHQ